MAQTGEKDGRPVKAAAPVADTMGGLSAAIAVMGALMERQRTGEGRFLDISMLDGLVALMGQSIAAWGMSGNAPRRFWRAVSGPDAGTLWFDNGQGAIPLLTGVTSMTFRRRGREIVLHMSVRGSDDGTVLTAETEATIRLLTP